MTTPGDHANAEFDRFLRAAVALRATQLSLSVDEPPVIEVDGNRKEMNRGPISESELNSMLSQILDASQMIELKVTGELLFERSVEYHGTEFSFDIQLHVYENNVIVLAHPN